MSLLALSASVLAKNDSHKEGGGNKTGGKKDAVRQQKFEAFKSILSEAKATALKDLKKCGNGKAEAVSFEHMNIKRAAKGIYMLRDVHFHSDGCDGAVTCKHMVIKKGKLVNKKSKCEFSD